MSFTHTTARSEASEPRRALRPDFTERVIRHAAMAQRRVAKKQRLQTLYKEIFTMKKLNFLRTVPGVGLVVAVVATSGVGVYALSNWFGGTVAVTQDTASTFSVDLSSCQGGLPPGFAPTEDRSNVQFKITGEPHISAQDLQKQLLGECEAGAVTEFYAKQFPDAGLSGTGQPSASTAARLTYSLWTASVKSIGGDGKITVSSTGPKGASFGTTDAHGNFSPVKTLILAPDATVYSKGHSVRIGDVKEGDNITFVAYSPGAGAPMTEWAGVLNRSDVCIVSIFRTQYDDGQASFSYPGQNVMPLRAYNEMHDPNMKTGPLVR